MQQARRGTIVHQQKYEVSGFSANL